MKQSSRPGKIRYFDSLTAHMGQIQSKKKKELAAY